MEHQAVKDIVPEHSDDVTTKWRPLYFLAAYFIGVIIATGLVAYPSLDDVSFVLNTFVGAAFFLPCGVVLALNWVLAIAGMEIELISFRGFSVETANVWVSALIGLSYLSCFILPLAGSQTKRQRTFRMLFFLFIGLLIINIGGCSLMG